VPAQAAVRTEWLEDRIRSIHPRGNTALFRWGEPGRGRSPAEHRPAVRAPGDPALGRLGQRGTQLPCRPGRLGTALRKEAISVSTVGVGLDFNEDLMTQLAERSDGSHYFVESSADLPRIFAQEFGALLSVVAQRVVVEIECPPGVRPLRIIGREGRIAGNRVEIRLNQV